MQERAAVVGQTLPTYTAQLVAETVGKPGIDELLAPVRADFAKSGMSDDELLEIGREALTAVRQESSRLKRPPTPNASERLHQDWKSSHQSSWANA